MDNNDRDDDRYHGAGIIYAAIIGSAWWLLAMYAFAQHGFKGLAVVFGVSILSVAAASIRLR